MTRGVFLFVLGISACGGSKAPPEAAPAGEPAGEESASPAEPAEAAAKEEAASPAESPASSEASSEDVNKALQLVIDDEELATVLKLGEPGRFPLKVSGSSLPSGLTLTKGTKPVEIVDAPKSNKDAVLVFTKIEIGAKEGNVSYRYDIEGVRGTAHLKKGEYGWELTSSRIVER